MFNIYLTLAGRPGTSAANNGSLGSPSRPPGLGVAVQGAHEEFAQAKGRLGTFKSKRNTFLFATQDDVRIDTIKIYMWLNEGLIQGYWQDRGCDCVSSLVDPACFPHVLCRWITFISSVSMQTQASERFVEISTDSPQQPQAKKPQEEKKNSQNEKAESAFISTATLIDILKVEQLLSVLTTAG